MTTRIDFPVSRNAKVTRSAPDRVAATWPVWTLLVLVGCSALGRPELASHAPLSSRWVLIEETDTYAVYADTASVIPMQSGIYQMWFQINYSTVQELLDFRYVARREVADFDCGSRSWRIHRAHLLSANGTIVFTSEYPDPSQAQFRPVNPESFEELQHSAACLLGPFRFPDRE